MCDSARVLNVLAGHEFDGRDIVHSSLRISVAVGALLAAVTFASSASASSGVVKVLPQRPNCLFLSFTCTEVADGLSDSGLAYTGHDEPSLLFYSNTPGSGNNNSYRLVLPKDPLQQPSQDGTGSTWNFQLHPAFWFGMALCDSQSSPEYTHQDCVPDSNSNIKDSVDPVSPNYIGKHAGTAFMEMQFYPPGWVSWPAGVSCSATQWCAALNIDSLSRNENTLEINNADCLGRVGVEPVNFAFITKSGVAHAPAGPLEAFSPPFASLTPNPDTDLFMSSGDTLQVELHDTPAGFQVVIHDLTRGTIGSMTASISNGFAQVLYQPSGTECHEKPYAFHPMYSTSFEETTVVWAAHTYNVAYSDEIGHFEYCREADLNGNCVAGNTSEPDGAIDDDDQACFNPFDSLLVKIGGCIAPQGDEDFDGTPYKKVWPGTTPNPMLDAKLHPQPITFTSPTFNAGQNYNRVAFETDLPAIEGAFGFCDNRGTGAGCTNPPPGAEFYPIFVTARAPDNIKTASRCVWEEGGPYLPNATNTFGGTSTTEYGSLLQSALARPGGPSYRYENYRRILDTNPCPA